MGYVAVLIIGIFAGFCIGVFAEASKKQTQKELETQIRLNRIWNVIESRVKRERVN